jgi:hypothetical protein
MRRWTAHGVCALLTLFARTSLAAWPSSSTTNLPICTAASDQVFPTVVSDGNSGVIITWMNTLVSFNGFYAQRVDFSGGTQWVANGVAMSLFAPYDYYGAPAIPDGTGGAIATYMAFVSGGKSDIYAQRINNAGANLWPGNGVAICTGTGDHEDPVIASDGAGGAIIAWGDHRGFNYDIYAQRVNAAGVVQWTADGVPVCTFNGEHESPSIVSDGAGGAIIAWQDHRSGNIDLFAQRLNSAGNPQWTVDGIGVCTNTATQINPTLMADGTGGAFVVWGDQRAGNYDIYAQRLSAAGASLWTAQGVPVCAATGDQVWPRMASDGGTGVIFSWNDRRTATQSIYAQRLNAAGTALWTANGAGVVVGGTTSGRFIPRIVSDGSGGAIIVWEDNNGTSSDLLAQRLTSTGAMAWPGGIAVSNAPGSQSFLMHGGEALNFTSVIADGAGGAIVAWEDSPSGGTADIYAQRIQHDGTLGGSVTGVSEPRGLAGLRISPNPARGTVLFEAARGAEHQRIEVLDVSGRPIWSRSLGAGGLRWQGETRSGEAARSGVYWARLTSGASVSLQRFIWLR